MGNCYRTPKPRRLELSQSTRLSVVPVLTISLKPSQTPKTLTPAWELDLVTSPNSGNNTARSHRRGRSDPQEKEEESGSPVDYFSGEESRESLILTPLADPAPPLPRHPLIPALNLACLKPEKTTLGVQQVQDKRSKWSRERQRGRLLLEVAKPASNSPSPESLLNAQTKSSSKESLPRPRNLLPMAQTSIRAVRSLQTTPKPKPRISLPKIPLVYPLVNTRRTEELGVSALTGTTIDEKSVLKNIESLPITMSQISGKLLFHPKLLFRPLVDRQITQQRQHARHTSLSVLKSNTKLIPSNPSCSPTLSYQERSAPVKMTTKMVKTRKPDGTIEVNDYQLIREVGAGAFGRVYEARKGDQQFAIKEYNKQKLKHVLIGKRKTALDTVKEEVAILSRIEHPNIVYLYEVIDSPDSRKTYLVMEYAAKGRLQDCLPLSELQAQGYFVQMVEAVEYLHEVVRVIHRDIKPDNILLDGQGNIKVSDFGSSQTMRNPDDTFTNTPGTPAFLSPEQCGGTKEFLGKPLDIWAMGVTLYYMLFNRPPFIARRLGDLYESIKSEEVNLSQEVSPELRDLLRRLLEKNPVKRIQLLELKEHPWVRRPANQSYA